ncbi:hypothetical protein TNCV_4028341 [Trichonephila clavipes]|nr:hypothetical protein TNCV_4028341 [Trichonephila clavipes]
MIKANSFVLDFNIKVCDEFFQTNLEVDEPKDGDLKLLALNVIAVNYEYALLTEWLQFAEKEPELMSPVLQQIYINKKKS